MADLNTDLAALRIDPAERGTRRSRRGVWIALVLLALAGAAAWIWAGRVQAVTVKTAAVAADTSGAAAPGAVLNASGYVTARRRATVSSKVTGKVVEVLVEEGHAVREGQVLARLDDTQARAALAYAEAQLAAAQSAAAEDQARLHEAELTFGRQQQLLTEGVVGRAELDSAQADVNSLKARIAYTLQQVQVAKTQVGLRRTDLNDTVVRAPFSGVAISKDAQPGEMISPVSAGGGFTRTGICTIVDMTSLEIEVDVNESYINRVRPDQRVQAVLDAYPDWRIPAHVIAVVPSADRQKATVKVRIGFDPSTGSGQVASASGALDPRILPDMGVKVSFLGDEPEPAAQARGARLLVPKAAVLDEEGRSVVFVVHDDRVERRAVTVGAAQAGQVEAVSGLTAGEHVVVNPPPTLKDGDKVQVQR